MASAARRYRRDPGGSCGREIAASLAPRNDKLGARELWKGPGENRNPVDRTDALVYHNC